MIKFLLLKKRCHQQPRIWAVLLTIFIVVVLGFPTSSSSSLQMLQQASPPFSDHGHWLLLQRSIGVSAMHMQLLPNNKVIIFDRTDFGPSNLSLPNSLCRYLSDHHRNITRDCTAHSLLYDVASNSFRPLTVQTDTWCSSGSLDPDGTLIQTGGYGSGERAIRTFTPCNNAVCDWNETSFHLADRRWYASNQILPDGRVIIVGGRKVFSYEFFPKYGYHITTPDKSYYLRFLVITRDVQEENNLYPFLHLLPDGNLFIFGNNRSISFDYRRNVVVREFPAIPGERRNYPCTGSSVLLPIDLTGVLSFLFPEAEVMICGGAAAGSFLKAEEKVYLEASRTCGRLRVSDPNPTWYMETMPMPRVMSDFLILPNGDLILINGAMNGSAGWDDGANPVLNPVIYSPTESNPARRFVTMARSRIPRMYHSSAVLLPDGRILVGGSNPHELYNFTARPYPTELSLESFSPPYLSPQQAPLRPSILTVEAPENTLSYGEEFGVTFVLNWFGTVDFAVSVNIVAPSFTTHSFAMNQRMIKLGVMETIQLSAFAYKVVVRGPSTSNVAPPGYYMLFVVHFGIPSHSVWVRVR